MGVLDYIQSLRRDNMARRGLSAADDWIDQKVRYYGGPQGHAAFRDATSLLSMFSDAEDYADAYRASEGLIGELSRGDMVGAGKQVPLLAAAAAAMMMPGISNAGGRMVRAADTGGGAARKAADEGITVYHGSPHDFDKFKLSDETIGTGEGAQAYGHGLYFAENEGVARSYREGLAEDVLFKGKPAGNWQVASKDMPPEAYDAIRAFASEEGNIPATIEHLEYMRKQMPALSDSVQKNIDWLKAHVDDLEYRPGRMYQARLHASPDDFLDWDKPLSEQPAMLNKAIERSGMTREQLIGLEDEYGRVSEALLNAERGTAEFEKIAAKWDELNQSPWRRLGRSLQLMDKRPNAFGYDAASKQTGETMAAAFNRGRGDVNELAEMGIPGIRYLDQGSRRAGEGSRNYVVFDDSIIEILKKYGWAGLVPLLGATQPERPQSPLFTE